MDEETTAPDAHHAHNKGSRPGLSGDSAVPRWVEHLGLTGLNDIHTHFLPDRMIKSAYGRTSTRPGREADCVPSATFFPEEGLLDHVRSALQRGAGPGTAPRRRLVACGLGHNGERLIGV